jgi:SAM-dependent methyltransferase
VNAEQMRRFWDLRAQENPLFFIDNQLDYGDPDMDAFFANGERALDAMLEVLGAELNEADDVVEIGCGAGRQTRALASRVATVRALDISERMLGLARELNEDLTNVDWLLGDGSSLAGLEDSSADACFSYVVFQHLPDPEVTLGYVREMARVLRPGGFAAFQISNDTAVHRKPRGRERLRSALDALRGRGPRGQADPAWLGSAVRIEDLSRVAADSGMELERLVGEGTQFCLVLARLRK